jgi:hypothetical protein
MGNPLPHPPLAAPHRERILPTPAGSVDVETAAALHAFCATMPQIAAAYVCAVEIIYESGELERRLRFSVQLAGPVVTSDETHAVLRRLAPRFGSEHPHLMRELGCGVLGDAAIAAWQENALRVY